MKTIRGLSLDRPRPCGLHSKRQTTSHFNGLRGYEVELLADFICEWSLLFAHHAKPRISCCTFGTPNAFWCLKQGKNEEERNRNDGSGNG